MMCNEFEDFPFHALLPKIETQANLFLTKHPNFDGRSVRIAIFDSGVDPGAQGLSVTSDGKPKIIDMCDATGAGDVDTSTVVEPDLDGYIVGLTKRKLKIPASWNNPTKKYHIGVKNIYELFPESVRARIKKDYFENEFLPKHKPLLAEAMQKYEDFKKLHPNDENIENFKERMDILLEKEELKSKVDILKNLQNKILDFGPSFDCVVFHDGNCWKACIDTTGEGNLEKCTLLGNYRECLKFGTISNKDKFNYVLNILDNGNLLEIVGQSSGHGTHVASITAANFPDDPNRNGVAPGAQIVSICIGDNRVSHMETGTALVRAFIKAIESKCDLINMSYGEFGHWADGRIFDLVHDLVNKHGLLYVASAGNAGPVLSSVGSPPTMNSELIMGIGAYVTPDMMMAEYSMREKLPGSAYSWSSRGPSINGGLGVTVCAPGAAITSVPNWLLQKGVLMNGTSMAAPNVTGCLALILSAMKQNSIPYSPYSIRKSIENTALKVTEYDPYSHGNGLIQVDKAYEHLAEYSKNSLERDIHFNVTCGANDSLGLYLRELSQVTKPSIHNVKVTPKLFKDTNQDAKINFEMNFHLTCGASWVQCPKYINLTYAPRVFQIRVDPTALIDGTVNQTWVEAYDVNCCEKGPVFKFLVTVIKPLQIENEKYTFKEVFKPGNFKRHFFHVPLNATSVVIDIHNNHSSEVGNFVLHTCQLLPQKSFVHKNFYKKFDINPSSNVKYSFEVIGGLTMEICVGKWWACSINAETVVEVKFFQVNLNSSILNGIIASDCITRIDVRNYEQNMVKCKPSVKLNKFVHTVRPTESKIRPLGSRDFWPEGKIIYELLLIYPLKFAKSTECTISFPLLSDLLYDSPFESQLWMLFDSNMQHIASGDAYPLKYFTKLDKGEYKAILQVRHDSLTQLESISELPIQVIHKLRDSIKLSMYNSHYDAIIGNESKKLNTLNLMPNIITPLFIKTFSNGSCMTNLKQLPIKSIGFLRGELSWEINGLGTACKLLNNFPISLFIDCDLSTKIKSTEELAKSNSDAENDSDLKSKSDEKPEELEAENKNVKTLMEQLQTKYKLSISNKNKESSNTGADECSKEKELEEQIDLANKILSEIELTEFINKYTTFKLDNKRLLISSSQTKVMEKSKPFVLDALIIKGTSLCRLIKHWKNQKQAADTSTEQIPSKYYVDVQDIYAKLDLLMENMASEPKALPFLENHALIYGHYARYIKILSNRNIKQSDEHGSVNATENSEIDIFKANKMDTETKIQNALAHLGWQHLVRHLQRQVHVKFPKSYRKF